MKTWLITGGAGFIGSALLRTAIEGGHRCIVLDKLTYAGQIQNIKSVINGESAVFIKGDICDSNLVTTLLKEYQVDYIVNLAAETHVDTSISDPGKFIDTNISGTYRLLEAAREYWVNLNPEKKRFFRFLHVSTDEVFGELNDSGIFSETTAYAPRSPYSASKAAADHLVQSWHHTFGLPTIVTLSSNNYGPRQFPEKLIPRMISCAIREANLPVYGQGLNIRDWIYVDDHTRGLNLALEFGKPGASYCFGGKSERKNIDVVNSIAMNLNTLKPRKNGANYKDLISFVEDRPGHDYRYAIDSAKAERDLGFTLVTNFEDGLRKTIMWYLSNAAWLKDIAI